MKRIVRLMFATLAACVVATAPFSAGRAGEPSTVTGVTERFTAENNVWFDSAPLGPTLLRGKVVLVNFWTYSCINSLRALPYTTSWAIKYKNAGLVVIGVHTPEFSFEKPSNVERAVHDLQVGYPVVMDSHYRIWQSFGNEYWPAFYLVDGTGRIRYYYFGEGKYGDTELVIQRLLKENGASVVPAGLVSNTAPGIEAPPNFADSQSPETYVGYRQGEHFASPERVARDAPQAYAPVAQLALNQWSLSGSWDVGAESGALVSAPGSVTFRFHSRDLHFVLGPASDGKPVRFKVTLDGVAPGRNCGVDCAPDGTGQVRAPRLYQLIRQHGRVEDRTFSIEFLDPGVHAYVFTFG